jgi:hypothetical protein
MNQMRSFLLARQRTAQMVLMLGLALAAGSCCAFAAETGTNLPWEGPLTTLVTSLTGPVACVVFAAQVMSSFIGQAAEISLAQPVHAITQPALALVARG